MSANDAATAKASPVCGSVIGLQLIDSQVMSPSGFGCPAITPSCGWPVRIARWPGRSSGGNSVPSSCTRRIGSSCGALPTISSIGHADHLGRALVAGDDGAAHVVQQHALLERVDDRAVALLADPQRDLGPLAGGDVGGDRAHAGGLAGRVEDRELDVEVGARLAADDDLELAGQRPLRLAHLEVLSGQLGGDVGREEVGVGAPADLLERHAQQVLEPVVGEHELASRVLQVDHGGRVVEDRLQRAPGSRAAPGRCGATR